MASWRGLWRQQANWLLLALAAAPTLLYFALHALSAEVLAQWPSAAYPIAIVAAVAALARPAHAGNGAPVMRYGVASAPWLALAMALTVFAQMTGRSTAGSVEPFFWLGAIGLRCACNHAAAAGRLHRDQ